MEPSLDPFTPERSLQEYVRKVRLLADEDARSAGGECVGSCVEEVVVTASVALSSEDVGSDSITNNQVANVDEGDIVKRIGDYLVVLRRGRLFSYSLPVEGQSMRAVDYIDVPNANESVDAWYDEMLTYGSTLVVLGFSYELNTALVRKFELSPDGELQRAGSNFITSSDYFDSDNYATRLVDGQLIMYLPRVLPSAHSIPVSGRLEGGTPVAEGNAIRDEVVYGPLQHSREPVLHTVMRCPIDTTELRCTATTVVGPSTRFFYISSDAVYLWINSTEWEYDYFLMSDRRVRRLARVVTGDVDDAFAVVYRIPLDEGRPGAVQARGWPMNQFSFRESAVTLEVFARDSPWRDQATPALLRIRLDRFTTEVSELEPDYYEVLPQLEGLTNVSRFVGHRLLYDDSSWKDDGVEAALLVKDLDSTETPVRLALPHGVERIEPIGEQAIVIGTDYTTGLGITPVGGDAGLATLGQTIQLDRAAQADQRSHAFNFRRDRDRDLFAIPVVFVPSNLTYDGSGYGVTEEISTMYFSLTPDLGLVSLGELIGRTACDDDCVVSCSDWYGDSRPLFIADRLIALTGYELIEGYLSGDTVYESARVDGLALLRNERSPSSDLD
jgi:hypothetical protein